MNPTPSDKIKYVFVLMLENHSFDVMLGLSGLPGVTSPLNNRNKFKNETAYVVNGPAPTTLTTDPGHELMDTLQQLTNKQQAANTPPFQWSPPLGPYNVPLRAYPRQDFPANFKNETGFVNNYVFNDDEDNPSGLPVEAHYGDTLKCFQPDQLPVLNALAREFAYCTNWFSSIPGPTWPNRFFLHFASSGGMDCSPTQAQIEYWALPDCGFTTTNGSIFQALNNNGFSYKIYYDCLEGGYTSCFSNDPAAGGGEDGGGWIPQVASLDGIGYNTYYELKNYLPGDLQNNFNIQYTFIEPHYGNIAAGTYQGGSSQHPMDDIYGGEALVKFVYETIRNSPVWDNSMLIITYDEHGGFYDSEAPPTATPPNDGSPGYGQPNTLNQFGFQFDQAGVRVPAVIVSPWIAKGVADDTMYDHTSVLKTLENLFGFGSLTARDAAATDVLSLLTETSARTDCPTTLPDPAPPSDIRVPPRTAEEIAAIDRTPLPESGNIIGTLGILRKLHYEVSWKNFITRWFIRWRARRVKTKGDLKAYSRRVAKKVQRKRRLTMAGKK